MEELKNKTPFNCIITGPTNCGKTNYLVDMLRNSYKNVFEYIVLICPTFTNNETYEGFGTGDPRLIVLSPDSDNVEEINDMLSCCIDFFSGHNTLIILDDCAFSKDLKQRSNKFVNLAFSGRHNNISVWVLTQQLTAIAKPFRENVACIISFYSPNKISNQTLFDEYGGNMDVEHKKHFLEIMKNNKYARVCICLRYPYYSYVEIPKVKI